MANPLQNFPPHIQSLLKRLHTESTVQESALTAADLSSPSFDDIMRDKFIALDEDKCQFIYQLGRAINAKTIVEAGTSFGVSTIYLALIVAANAAATGGQGRVIATEYEPEKAQKAREHWRQCGEIIENVIDLREGDLRETLKENVKDVDLLLLDSIFDSDDVLNKERKLTILVWPPMALPTLKLIQPKMRYGAVVIIDNTIKSGVKYNELLDYLRAPESGFTNLTLPHNNGLEMCIYLPHKE